MENKAENFLKSFFCGDCDGWGVVGQSPSNPAGDQCQACDSTGFNRDGSIARDMVKPLSTLLEEK